MGRIFESIDDALAAWIAEQALFFVATAPLDRDGHVNLSPKGPIGSLRVLGPRQIAYLDVIGSGAETIAHLRENGRIVIMLCAFSGPPRILRLHGHGTVLAPDSPDAVDLLARATFEDAAIPDARRALVVVDVTRIATSCGFDSEFLQYFAVVHDNSSACGRAAREGSQTVIADVHDDPGFAPHREIAAASRFRAVQSTPIVDPDGRLHGVISTHFRDRHHPEPVQMQLLHWYSERVGAALACHPHTWSGLLPTAA